MKRTISKALLFVSGAAMLLLAACSKTPEQGKHIPKNAALVMGINSKQIQEKLISEGMSVEKLLSSIQRKDTNDVFSKALAEAANSGLDMQGDVYIAMVPGASGQSYFAAYASVKDAAKFEAYIKDKTKKEVKQGTDFKYIESEGSIGFDKNMVIGVFSFNMPSSMGADMHASQTGNVETLNTLFHLKAEESVAKVESFQDAHKAKADVTFWMSNEQIYALNMGSAAGMAAMMTGNIKKLTEGSFQTATLNFEKGKIKAESISYPNQAVRDMMDKYPSKKVDMDMLEKYPSQNIFGFALTHFDLRILGEIVKLLGMDGMANMALAEAQITMDDILKAFTGEIAVIGSDFSVVSKPSEWDSTYNTTKPDAKWVFTIKVGDKAAFEKVMNSPAVGQMFTKQGSEYVPNQPLGALAVSINDKRILAASDAQLLADYSAGKGKAGIDGSVKDKVKDGAMSVYFNVEKIINNMPEEEMKKELPDSIVNDLKGLLKDFYVISEPGSGKKQRSTMELNFKNDNQNSLAQIASFTTRMYNFFLEKQAADRAAWAPTAVDSAMGAPIVDTVAVSPEH